AARLQRLQILHEIALLLGGQAQLEVAVVMLDHVIERREATVVVKAAFSTYEQPPERCGAIALVRRTLRLEFVDSDLRPGVHRPTRLREERLDVAATARRLSEKEVAPTVGGRLIVALLRRFWRRERQLILVERRELRRDEVRRRPHVVEVRPL